MTTIEKILEETRQILFLSLPLSAAFAGNQLMSLVDTAIVGRLGAKEIAGTGLGSSLYFIISIIGVGVLLGLDPLVSQAFGAKESEKAQIHLKHALSLSFLLFLPLFPLCLGGTIIFQWIGIEAPVREQIFHYLLGRAPSMLPLFLYVAFKSYLQALTETRWIMWATIIANIVNVPLNIFLAFGDRALEGIGLSGFGFQGWGVFGVGLASTLVSALQAYLLARVASQHFVISTKIKRSWQGLYSIMRIGWPIAIQLVLEGGLFVIVTVIMGTFGARIVGGHQIALQIASFTFMVCLGISSGTSVRVGHAIGRKDFSDVRLVGFAGTFLGVMLMLFSALLLWGYPRTLATIFAKSPEVVEAALPFLSIAAIFQIFDGIQVVLSGALRGAGDTKYPMFFYMTAHWLIGFPLALYLTFIHHIQPVGTGLWWGLTAGLVTASLSLIARFHLLTHRLIFPR